LNIYVYTQIQGQINIAHFLYLGTVGGAEQLYILKLANAQFITNMMMIDDTLTRPIANRNP